MPHKLICLIAVLFLFICTRIAIAQHIVLSGDVRDQNTHQKIKSVNIFVKGTHIGTTSDFTGNFELKVPDGQNDLIIVFQHIAYYAKPLKLSELIDTKRIYLQPRVIPLNTIEIEEEGVQRIEIEKDLPQAVTVINARSYDIRGYVDAGDLLQIDQSVQVEEDLSGRKTVAIRGGNADEVIVLYNGIKMNNVYNNIFDLSLIDLENVERLELIKGSNTALYGPEAFSGVINIVPKLEQDYTIRFQQRLGTYRSGNWGVHLYKKINRLYGSYSLKRGGLSRSFVDVTDNNGNLENTSLHHNAILNFDVGTNSAGEPRGTISSMWVYTALNYDNFRDNETLDNFNNLFSLRYKGALLGQKNVDLSFAYKNLEEEQALNLDRVGNSASGVDIDRELKDRAYIFNSITEFSISDLDLLLSYQFQRSELSFFDSREGFQIQQTGLEEADLSRNHHGLVSILKYHGDTGSDFFQSINVDVSLRHDRVYDNQKNIILRGDFNNRAVQPGKFGNNNWYNTMFKFALDLSGYRDGFSFNSYLTFGNNTKFPTLFQQISLPSLVSDLANTPNLDAEKNKSLELGLNLGRDIRGQGGIYGWKLSGSFFQNHYENKFREFTTPGIPVSFYDNVQNANISGVEGKAKIFLFQKKVSLDLGISKYSISDKAAFPFKSDQKRTLTFNVDHAGYAFQLFWFNESEQVALLRFPDGSFDTLSLPTNTNLDLHFGKTFEISDFKVFANASGRNLLNDSSVTLEGLAIRDRRFYLTFGLQY